MISTRDVFAGSAKPVRQHLFSSQPGALRSNTPIKVRPSECLLRRTTYNGIPMTVTMGNATMKPWTSIIGSHKATSDGLTAKSWMMISCAIFTNEHTNELNSTAHQYFRTHQCVPTAITTATALNKRKSRSVMQPKGLNLSHARTVTQPARAELTANPRCPQRMLSHGHHL